MGYILWYFTVQEIIYWISTRFGKTIIHGLFIVHTEMFVVFYIDCSLRVCHGRYGNSPLLSSVHHQTKWQISIAIDTITVGVDMYWTNWRYYPPTMTIASTFVFGHFSEVVVVVIFWSWNSRKKLLGFNGPGAGRRFCGYKMIWIKHPLVMAQFSLENTLWPYV